MTGADFYKRFKAVADTVMNGIIPTSKMNEQIAEAQTEYFIPMMKAYGINSTVNAELEPLIVSQEIVNPTNNKVSKDTDLPNYFIPISVETTFVDGVNSYTRTSQILLPNSMVNSYTSGTVIYPRHDINSTDIILYPSNKTCSKAVITYFRKLFTIDVTDDTTQLPYNVDSISGILDQVLSIYGLSLGDSRYNAFEREERENTKVTIK